MKKKQQYPTKNTLNLNKKDIPAGYYRKILLGMLIGIAAIAAFAKFAVIDRLDAAANKEAEAASLQAKYEQLRDANHEYTDVKTEYEKYFTDLDTSMNYIGAAEVLDLIDAHIRRVSEVNALTLNNNILSVVIIVDSPRQVSDLVNTLSMNEYVVSVNPSSLDDTQIDGVILAGLTITLTPAAEGGQANV
jgi:hypothetical protein